MLTTKQFAQKLGVSQGRVRQLVKMKRITKCKLMGNSLVFSDRSKVIPVKWGRPQKELLKKWREELVILGDISKLSSEQEVKSELSIKVTEKELKDILSPYHFELSKKHLESTLNKLKAAKNEYPEQSEKIQIQIDKVNEKLSL